MTLTADTYGEDFLENGELDLFEEDPDHPCNLVMMMMVVMMMMIHHHRHHPNDNWPP